jgi:hypothetical protein
METPWKKYKEKNGVTPLDLLRPSAPVASEQDSNNRLNTCRACPEFMKLTSLCKKCGCNMLFKTKLQEAKCPIGKW